MQTEIQSPQCNTNCNINLLVSLEEGGFCSCPGPERDEYFHSPPKMQNVPVSVIRLSNIVLIFAVGARYVLQK